MTDAIVFRNMKKRRKKNPSNVEGDKGMQTEFNFVVTYHKRKKGKGESMGKEKSDRVVLFYRKENKCIC